MDRHVSDLVAELAAAFPQRPVPRQTLAVYVRHLEDIDLDSLEVAVRGLIRTSEFFPTVHAIRTAVAEAALGLPTEGEALAAVTTRGVVGLHPLVREALDMVGGYHAWRITDNPGVMRGQFTRIYREMREERLREFVVGEALPPGPPVRELTP
jgi:hypothetical protein